jgi:hypothetical protein
VPIEQKLAYTIADLVKLGPNPRTQIFEEIKRGRLRARRCGRRTIVLRDDYAEYLQSLPILNSSRDEGDQA